MSLCLCAATDAVRHTAAQTSVVGKQQRRNELNDGRMECLYFFL